MSARRFYGRWARLYDLLAAAPGVDAWRARAVDALGLAPGETVVEMGCGTGANVPHLCDRVGPGGRVVGIDLSRAMLERARNHPDRRGTASGAVAGYTQGDARRPPVREADAVLATFVVGIFEEPAAVVDRWCELVGRGGRVALLNFQRGGAGAVLDPLLEGIVRLSSPGSRLERSRQVERFQRRVTAGREALTARTRDRRFETVAGGLVGLLSGRVE